MPYIGSAIQNVNTRSAVDHQQLLGSMADTTIQSGYSTFFVNYSPGNVTVSVAGVQISHANYIATNGTDVRILNSAVTINANDAVEITGFNVPTSQVLERTNVNITGGTISNVDFVGANNTQLSVGLPIVDSSGNNIISESGGNINLRLAPSSAPSNPIKGDIYLDSTDNHLKIHTGFLFVDIANASDNLSVQYVVVGGGGSGGDGTSGGGGGAGGYRSSVTSESSGGGASVEPALTIEYNTSYMVTIGSGGTASVGTSNQAGTNGNNTQIFNIISLGGGGGAGEGDPTFSHNGKDGGSGGGTTYTGVQGNGIATQGYNGGIGTYGSNNWRAGGGGGAGAVGGNSVGSNAGNGGIGVLSSITGVATYYAGGGGGAIQHLSGSGLAGAGGSGGGGNGARDLTSNGGGSVSGGDGGANTGGGGGGGANDGATSRGGNGGSGIVIISYLNTYPDLQLIDTSHTCRGATTVSGTTTPPPPNTNRAGYKTYEFLSGSGNIRW